MKILVISDLHYDKCVFKGVDESRAWEWLLSIVDYRRPNYLLSCDDWGTAVNPEEFHELLEKTTVLSIYGNHENLEVLKVLHNVRGSNLPVLMEDGRIYEVNSLRIAGISEIIASKRKIKKGVPMRTPDEFIAYAEKLRDKNIDVLVIHETPYLPELFPFMRDDYASRIALRVVETVKPRRFIINIPLVLIYYRLNSDSLDKVCEAVLREGHYLSRSEAVFVLFVTFNYFWISLITCFGLSPKYSSAMMYADAVCLSKPIPLATSSASLLVWSGST